MRDIATMKNIQIDITNICNRSCANCTRFCGHYTKDKTYYMDLEYYEKAVWSLRNFPGRVGMIGGEPTLHPQFEDMCHILNKYIKAKPRKGLWSNRGKKFQEHIDIIKKTFGFFNLNDHVSNKIMHTPILTAAEDLLADGRLTEEQYKQFTDDCWIQMTWSATITPKGGYFCEVAGTMAYLFDGPDGWDITDDNWWRKKVPEYKEQIDWACPKCGCQLPLAPKRSTDEIDDISPSNLKRLEAVNSPKIKQRKYVLNTEKLDLKQKRDGVWYWNRDGKNGR